MNIIIKIEKISKALEKNFAKEKYYDRSKNSRDKNRDWYKNDKKNEKKRQRQK